MSARESSDEPIVLRRGLNGPYHWLEATGDVSIDTLLRLCPEAVLNRYLAVTSYDSGVRPVSEEERSAGWELRGEIVYSPGDWASLVDQYRKELEWIQPETFIADGRDCLTLVSRKAELIDHA